MLPFTPENIQVEISNRCNLRCPLCPTGAGNLKRKKQDIDLELFEQVIAEIRHVDPRMQLWNYGEPLMHENIREILKLIPSEFSRCEISTNGHIMSENLAQSIVYSGLTKIIFAIDGISQRTYEQYRRGGSLYIVLENLKKVSDAKRQQKSDIEITVQFIILKHNFHEIPRLGEFFRPYKVDKIIAKSAMMMLEGDNSDLIAATRKYLHMDYPGERYEILNNQFELKGKPLERCPLIENSLVVTTDGTILPCCWDYKTQFPINDKGQWTKVRKIINSDSPPKMCKKCPVRNKQTFSWDWDKVPGVDYQ